jgi:hypothetical protein
MQYHHDFQHPSPLVIPPRILDLLHRAVDLFADQSGADDESDGPRQSLGPVLVPPWRERLGVPVSNTSVVPIRPDPHQNNSLSLVGGANSGDDSPRLPLYYSKNKNNRRRDKNSHSETRSGSHGYYSRSFSSDRGMTSPTFHLPWFCSKRDLLNNLAWFQPRRMRSNRHGTQCSMRNSKHQPPREEH